MKGIIHFPETLIGCLMILLSGLAEQALAVTGSGDTMGMAVPSDPFTFQPGPGSRIASAYCGMCHSAEYVYMQPPHSQEKWGGIVHKMKSAFGCPIPDEQIPPLVEYLVSQNTILPTSRVQEATVKDSTLTKSQSDIGNGKTIYEHNCVPCHGIKGKGDGPLGTVLVPPASDLTATGKKSNQELLQTIQEGRPGTAMPSWKGGLSSQDIQDVLAYIRRLSK